MSRRQCATPGCSRTVGYWYKRPDRSGRWKPYFGTSGREHELCQVCHRAQRNRLTALENAALHPLTHLSGDVMVGDPACVRVNVTHLTRGVLLAASGYAFLPVFTRFIYSNSELRPTDIGIWRFVFATPMIWFFIWLRERKDENLQKTGDSPEQILSLMALGILYAGAAIAAFFGLQYIPASIFGTIFYTYPAFVALIALFLGQRLALAAWAALAVTLVGVLLTVPDLNVSGENTALGVGIAILNALFVAFYFTLVSRVMKKSSSVMRGSAYVITGTLFVLLFAIPFFGFRLPQNQIAWLLLLGLASVSTAMPIAVVNLGINKIGAAQASIISTFEPVLTMVLALLFLNETILPMQWLSHRFGIPQGGFGRGGPMRPLA